MENIELAFYSGAACGSDLLIASGLFKAFFTVILENKTVKWLDIDFDVSTHS